MNIRRNARVETADGEFGRVTHVIVDPQTHEVTDLVVGRHGSGWLVPIGAVKRADGAVITLHGERERYVKAMPFVRDDYHAVSDRQALEQPGPARHGGASLLEADDDHVVVEAPGTAEPTVTGATAAGEAASPAPLAGAGEPAAESAGPFRLRLREERLRIEKQQEQIGAVRLRRETVEREESVRVPLREERLIVERIAGNGTVIVGGRELSPGESVTITLSREQAHVSKETVPVESVTARVETVERTEAVQATLRKEELDVDDRDQLVADGDGASGSRRDEPASAHQSAAQENVLPGDRQQVLTGDRSDRSVAERRADGIPDGKKDAEAAKLAPSPLSSGTGSNAAPGPRISAEFNPGAAEYAASGHGGPGGTEKAVGPAHHEAHAPRPASNAAAQHEPAAREEAAAAAGRSSDHDGTPGGNHPQQTVNGPSSSPDTEPSGYGGASGSGDSSEQSQETHAARPTRPS
ncbi:MAG TPA: YsnF/AvaK domain-containing protein [Dehalococcoidia bacterium]|nr:YsnF/AvaK domain-containing protein [Dehalococcoidia bacterium]